MKKLLVLATMLLTFGFANSQKIWNNAYKDGRPVGTYEGGKIWNNAYKDGRPVGTYEGGEAGGAAAAFILLL
jgi:hypothetical protein